MRSIARLAWTMVGSVAWTGNPAHSQAQTVPILTVCQILRNPGQYSGQTVIVVGRSVGTDEGSWLDESCGLNVVIQGRPYRTSISTSYAANDFAPPPRKPSGFKWDKNLLQQALNEVKKTTQLEQGAHWYAVYGRLEAEPTRTIKLRDGRVGNTVGYGHLGGAPAQMIAADDGFLRLR